MKHSFVYKRVNAKKQETENVRRNVISEFVCVTFFEPSTVTPSRYTTKSAKLLFNLNKNCFTITIEMLSNHTKIVFR